jgi:para-nitrobenzyl esterase
MSASSIHKHSSAGHLLAGVAVVVLVVLALGALGCGPAGLEQVRLESGLISGSHEQVADRQIWTFKGIPYAAPPVGELRWRPPQPVEPWDVPRVCTAYGPACPQPGMLGLSSLVVGRTAEDCLYLNVWSPARSADERLPVMVWIHGGSFETGSGSMAIYNGRRLAARGVVVVTINYRLGPLGFLAHPALSAEAENGVGGNYGLMDQIAALEWVQANITGFGGDPGNVTVFGESAGGVSILDLIVSPPAGGLFQRAIVESGILLDQGFGVTVADTRERAEDAGRRFAEGLAVEASGDVAAQLRAKTPVELLDAATEVAEDVDSVGRILLWKPVVDGYVLPAMPTELWRTGRLKPVSLLIGSNADEAELFLGGLRMSRGRYEAEVARIFGEHADEALALYEEAEAESPTLAISRMLTEIGFASSARFAADIMSRQAPAPEVYLYEFTRAPLRGFMGAFHAVELPYVFGTLDLFGVFGIGAEADRRLSEDVIGYWTRFATTGDPNGGGAPIWPRYTEASSLHLDLGDVILAGPGLYEAACDFADRIRGVD